MLGVAASLAAASAALASLGAPASAGPAAFPPHATSNNRGRTIFTPAWFLASRSVSMLRTGEPEYSHLAFRPRGPDDAALHLRRARAHGRHRRQRPAAEVRAAAQRARDVHRAAHRHGSARSAQVSGAGLGGGSRVDRLLEGGGRRGRA